MRCLYFNDTATTEIYTYGHTLSLHDALPIAHGRGRGGKRFLEVNEKLQLVLQDASGISNRIFGSHGPVSLKSQRQLVIVQFLPDAGIFNLVGDLLDRGKQRVDRDQANGCVRWAVGDGRNIAFADNGSQLHVEGRAFVMEEHTSELQSL